MAQLLRPPAPASADAPAPLTAPERSCGYPREADAGTVELLPSDRRHLRLTEAKETAEELSAERLLAKRIDIYNRRGRNLVFLAAGRWPELMPICNGEFEFLELMRADHD